MKTPDQELQKTQSAEDEAIARPLARLTAREISTEELARIAGGWFISTYSNNGGPDVDWLK
ncbi:MAG: hypothetical protein JXB05_33190 [Myxococcaceae bacterium]|nr:hypothetical protein [Myxococcaceae bacterium]